MSKGATFIKKTGKWKSQVKIKGKNVHLGYFLTKEEAEKKAAPFFIIKQLDTLKIESLLQELLNDTK